MLDAVWRQEMLASGRRHRTHWMRGAFAGVLLIQLIPVALMVLVTTVFPNGRHPSPSQFYAWLFEAVVTQHFVFLLLLTPALTAGALTDEKTRRTFEHLLTTAARPLEIVLGKLLSRTSQLLILSLVTLPLVCFFGAYGSLDPAFPAALLGISAIFVAGLAAFSLLASALCRQTRDAVLGVYGFVILGLYIVSQAGTFGPVWLREALSPWHAMALDDPTDRWPRLGHFALAWLPAALVCTLLAAWVLRPAYLWQLRATGRRRWGWNPSPVSDDPVAWREAKVQGFAPFAWLRAFPRWLGLLTVGLACAASLFWMYVERLLPDSGLAGLVRAGDLSELWEAVEIARGSTFAYDRAAVHGILAMLLFTLPIAVRASGTICEERERGTWEPLLLTPLTTREIVRGKFWGVVRASLPYVAVYALAVLPLAMYFGPGLNVSGTLIFLGFTLAAFILTVMATVLLTALGVCCSAHAKGAWRSLFATVGLFYVASYVIFNVLSIIIFLLVIGAMMLGMAFGMLWNALRGEMLGAPLPEAATLVFGIVVGVLSVLVTVSAFVGMTYSLLQVAETRIDFRERVSEGPTHRRRSKRSAVGRRSALSREPGT